MKTIYGTGGNCGKGLEPCASAGASELKAGLGFLRPDVLWFASCMEYKLRENDHKGTWEHLDDAYLMRRLLEEVGELFTALLEGRNEGAIRDEAVDVANFAMMLADNAMTKKPNIGNHGPA